MLRRFLILFCLINASHLTSAQGGLRLFAARDSAGVQFYNNNEAAFQSLYDSLCSVPTDVCHHNSIKLILHSTVGAATLTPVLSEGSGSSTTDSLLLSIVEHFKTSWNYLSLKSKGEQTIGTWSLQLLPSAVLHKVEWTTSASGLLVMEKTADQGKCEEESKLYEKGVEYFKAENYSKAIKSFAAARKLNPLDTDVLYNLAICHIKNNETEQACECLKAGVMAGDGNAQRLLLKYCGK